MQKYSSNYKKINELSENIEENIIVLHDIFTTLANAIKYCADNDYDCNFLTSLLPIIENYFRQLEDNFDELNINIYQSLGSENNSK